MTVTDVKVGTPIGEVVGSKVELVSIEGSKKHSLYLSNELADVGLTVTNPSKGLFVPFTMAVDNTGVYAGAKTESANEATFAQPSRAVDIGQKFG